MKKDPIKKYEIFQVNLNPTKGSEQKGIRPCLVLQNNEANKHSNTTVVAIFSTVIKKYPHTLVIQPSQENGLKTESRLDLLQIRTIDQSRLIKKYGTLEKRYRQELYQKLIVSFDMEDLFEEDSF